MAPAAARRWRLLRRVSVLRPTLWGWLLLTLAIVATMWFGARHFYGFLAVNEPVRTADGRGARILVVEGWLGETELDAALDVVRRGHYEHVWTTGEPIRSWRSDGASYAERAARYLRTQGLESPAPVALVSPASTHERTYLSATAVRGWALRNGVTLDRLDVFSAGPHARRSRMTYQLALGKDVQVGIYATEPEAYDGQPWSSTSVGAKATLGEGLGLLWTLCCFWPGPPSASAAAVTTSSSASRP